MEYSHTWVAYTWSARQEITLNLCNLKARYHVQKSEPLFPTQNQVDSLHTLTCCLFKIHPHACYMVGQYHDILYSIASQC
jgi:hypothetical protein